MSRSPLLIASFLCALTGCKTGTGYFGEDGFRHAEYPIVLSYSNAANYELLGPDWELDNMQLDQNSKPARAKTGAEWEVEIGYDINRDGEIEHREQEKYFRYDLRLAHKQSSGVIWLRTVLLPEEDTDRRADVLVRQYAASIGGTLSTAPSQSTGVPLLAASRLAQPGAFFGVLSPGLLIYSGGRGNAQTQTKTLVATVTSTGAATIAGAAGARATIEIADGEELKLDPHKRAAKMMVILAPTDHFAPIPRSGPSPDLRMMIEVGYSAQPQDFEAGIADFERFIAQIRREAPTSKL